MAVSFGKEILRREFMLNPEATFINHGSKGTVPKCVYQERIRLQEELEFGPDDWFRKNERIYYDESLQVVADFVGATPDCMAFVTNATTGMNCAIKSLPLRKGDAIMLYSWTYKAVRNATVVFAESIGVEVVDMAIDIAVKSVDEFVDKYRQCLQNNPNIKAVVLDYISCPTAMLLPLDKLIPLCKKHGALVVIDAAHAAGQVDLNLGKLSDLGADFIVGNLHKWLFAPRGCAILWAHPRHHQSFKPILTCLNFSGNFPEDFYTQASADRTPYLVAKDSIKFYRRVGGLKTITEHNTTLLEAAVELLTKAWGTQTFPVPAEMFAPFMRVVGMPVLESFLPGSQMDDVAGVCDLTELMTLLRDRFGITTRIVRIRKKIWFRISAQIYNELSDYQKLLDAVDILLAEESET